MRIIERPSPNFNERAGGAVDMLVLHYTGMISREHAMARMCDPQSRVSAHYLVDETGRAYQLVDEAHRAWHAGVSFWAGERDINSRSIGIELVNPGHDLGYRNFPLLQMRALAQLCLQILARHAIPAKRVLGHSDVAPGRKRDPGEKFDWAWLAGQGIGIWPVAPENKLPSLNLNSTPPQTPPHQRGGALPPDSAPLPHPGGEGRGGGHSNDSGYANILQLQRDLGRFGYDIPQTGIYGTRTRAVITAFQRHFLPDRVHGVADAHMLALLKQLLA